MPFYQLSFIFNAERQGWSETWYTEAATRGLAMQKARLVADKRLCLVGAGVKMDAVRVSNVAEFKDALIDYGVGNTPCKDTSILNRDLPSMAWLARCSAGGGPARSIWLRGIPDEWVKFKLEVGFIPEIPPLLVQSFTQWAETCVQNGFLLNALDKVTHQEKEISNLAVTLGEGKCTVTSPNHGIPNLKKVRIRNCKGTNASNANGEWITFNVTQDTFEIRSPTAFAAAIAYIGGGLVRRQEKQFVAATEFQLVRPAQKDTGRAFFVPRGRRSVKRKA